MKRVFDIIFSLLGLIILSPVLLLVAILISFSSTGPAIFRQIRTGRYGKPFVILKFRTMSKEHSGGTISIKGESRITPLGSILRKYKIDELPELINVLKGDMSFVGPRPDMPEYYSNLRGDEQKILELRPGITGPASLKYANEEELLASVDDPLIYNDKVIWPDKVSLNLDYYYTRTFFGDIILILKTVFRKSSRREFSHHNAKV